MEIQNIINHFDLVIKQFCNENRQYNIFRIGSSLFADSIPIPDIDYLLINDSSIIDYSDQIIKLKKEFSGKGFLKATISTFDECLNIIFIEAETSAKIQLGVDVKHAFGFGPISKSLGENSFVLHLAGPMNAISTNTFFKQFPIFYLVFSKFNLKLGTKEFTSIIEDPGFTKDDVQEDISRIYKRAKNINSILIKKQCLKRIKLVELITNNHPNPYVESFNYISGKSNNEIIEEIEKYAM